MNFLNKFKLNDKNNNTIIDNNNNNYNNNYNNNNNNLFFKIWRNLIIRNKIFNYNRNFKKINDLINREYNSVNQFDKDNYNIKSIILNNSFENNSSFFNFFETLPNNIESVEIKNSILYIDIKKIIIKSNGIKKLTIDDQLYLVNKEPNDKYGNYKIKNLSKVLGNNQLYGIHTMNIGFNCEDIIYCCYLPNTLTNLTTSSDFKRGPIMKNHLPIQLKSLSIKRQYNHSTIYLPKDLKEFNYGSGNGVGSMVLSTNIINNCLPSNLEILRLEISCDISKLKSFNLNQMKSLKKLQIFYEYYQILFENLFNITTSPLTIPTLSITNLDLSSVLLYNKKLNIDLLPPTLIKLKLPIILTISTINGRGFPGSLTSLEGYINHLQSKFENPSNLQFLTIKTFQSQQNLVNIDLNQFSNLKSLKYLDIDSINRISIPNLNQSLINLEITCSNNFLINNINNNNNNNINNNNNNNNNINNGDHDNLITIKKIIDLSKTNIKSFKIDEKFSYFLFSSSLDIKSIFPQSLILLDFKFLSSKLIKEQSFYYDYPPFSINNLPPNLKILIITGDKPSFKFPLPNSLENILISNKNPISKFINIELYELSNIISFFNEDYFIKSNNKSKLYNKIKKFI